MKKARIWISLLFLSLVLYTCGQSDSTTESGSSESASLEFTRQEEVQNNFIDEQSTDGAIKSSLEHSSEIVETTVDVQQQSSSLSSKSSFSIQDINIESYSGNPYIEINNNIPYFSEIDLTTEPFESYSDLDELGRCGTAYANICIDIMPTEERGEIGQIRPSGWHTVKYDDIIDGNYLYNRCHLIGYQLAGENANEKNLITGTRYMNVDGMLPFENMVADYVIESGNHVIYRVTPIFEGNNLLASGVLMEAESVEDKGSGILFCVYVYNVQPGIIIDYASGESSLDESLQVTQEEMIEEPEIPIQSEIQIEQESENASIPESPDVTYVLNTNTKKFHYPSCSSVNQMKEKNKRIFTGNRDDVISQGYEPCKRCNP